MCNAPFLPIWNNHDVMPTGIRDYALVHSAMVQLATIRRGGRLVYHAAPRWTLAWTTLIISQGLLPAAIVWLSRPLVDGLAAAAASGGAWAQVVPLLPVAGALLGAMALNEALGGLAEW